MSMVGKASLHRHRVQAFANRISGPITLSFFKKREEFSSDEAYRNYVRANIKPGVILQLFDRSPSMSPPLPPNETLGQVVDDQFFGNGHILVKWQNGTSVVHDMNL